MKVTGFLNKLDLAILYATHPRAFSSMIDPIKKKIGWKVGQQRFTSKQVQIIIEYLGPPIIDISQH